jgi:heme-degrading monooxygenase HmoA
MEMLKHVVMFKFKKETQEIQKVNVGNALRELPSLIAEIRGFEVGNDVLHSERSYDMVLISLFENLDSMQRYQVHPAHQEVVEKLKKVCDSILVVDFKE